VHLSTPHHNSLLALLLKFEELFDGTLWDWKLPPASFELKEVAKPYHGRPYPITLDFKERTITIDEILLPMRNINNLQLKPSISRALNSLSAMDGCDRPLKN
jgi:hypothetical protein